MVILRAREDSKCAYYKDDVTVTISLFQCRPRFDGKVEWVLKHDLKPLQAFYPAKMLQMTCPKPINLDSIEILQPVYDFISGIETDARRDTCRSPKKSVPVDPIQLRASR